MENQMKEVSVDAGRQKVVRVANKVWLCLHWGNGNEDGEGGGGNWEI